jgi:hypothetical protein
LLFLPPYLPDFNPIEMAFSKLKALLRKAAERTVEGSWTAIGQLIDTITPDQCANFFAAAEYEPEQIEIALEDEGLIERVGGGRHPKWRRSARSTAGPGLSCPPLLGWMAPRLDERLARELIQGLVQSAVTRGGDPVARLQEFRTHQEAAMAVSQDPAVAGTTECLIRAIDLTIQELTAVKS